MEDAEKEINIPESLKSDTGHTSQHSSQPGADVDEKHQQHLSPEHAEQDAAMHEDEDEHSAENCTIESTSTQTEQPLTAFLPDDITVPTKKVGCILVTTHLQQFLEDYPPSSDKHAFLDVYHMLSLLEKYLYENLKQHTHCMSSDNEYVTLLKYAICLNIDLSMFPTLWAVLYSPLYSRW